MEVEKKHSTNDSKLEELRSLVTNQVVLIWVAIFFALFVVAEMIGALASGSLSLLGDASAMAVDVITYFTNLYAEIMKQKHQVLSNQTRMILEVYIPLFSVIALLSVTGYITSDAISVLSSPSSDGDGVNIYFLWAFSSANGLVDIASVTLFYLRGKQGLIAKDLTKEHDTTPSSSSSGSSSSGDNTPVSVELPAISSNVVEEDEENAPVSPTPLLAGHSSSSSSRPKRKCIPNLNMMSALTHVSSDSLRTTSVFVAAAISSSTGLSSTRCDAWASIIVTMTILLCILPLCREIYHSYHSLSSSSSASS